jgi:hypothetical protein
MQSKVYQLLIPANRKKSSWSLLFRSLLLPSLMFRSPLFIRSNRVVLFTAFVLAGISAFAQNGKTVIKDPNVALRTVKSFHAIEVSNGVDLYLSQADKEAVAVSAKDSKTRDRIRTEVVDGVLKIGFEKNGWGSWEGSGKKLKAYIAFTTLDRLAASGASDVFVDGIIAGNSLVISLSGASDFKGAVQLNELFIDQSGASDIHITGKVAGLTNIKASGASNIKGYELVTENCTAHISGASDIRITVNKELNAHATGASSLYYKGDAVIRELHSSGASSVSKKS